jgi:hypothetical protein
MTYVQKWFDELTGPEKNSGMTGSSGSGFVDHESKTK